MISIIYIERRVLKSPFGNVLGSKRGGAANGRYKRSNAHGEKPPMRIGRAGYVVLCPRACTHKIAIGDSDLINVRIGPLCGLTPDISRGPRSTIRRPEQVQQSA